MRGWLGLTLLSGLASTGFAGDRTAADFLELPVSARSIGIGRATSALGDAVEGLNNNPAGMAELFSSPLRSSAFSVSHQELFLNRNLDQLGFAMPSNRVAVGLNVLRMSYNDQEVRLADGTGAGRVGAEDLSVGAVMAYQVKGIRIGTQVKWIQQRLASKTANGVAADLGFQMPTRMAGLSFGGAVRNLGPGLRFVSDQYPLPLLLSFGTSYRWNGLVALSAECRREPRQSRTTLSLGTEIFAASNFILRGGYSSPIRATSEYNDPEGGPFGAGKLTGGLGIRLARFSIDYALQPFGQLGNAHAFTVSAHFAGPPAEESKAVDDPRLLQIDLSDPLHPNQP